MAFSYTICIRVSYSIGPLFTVVQVQPDHSESGGAGLLMFTINEVPLCIVLCCNESIRLLVKLFLDTFKNNSLIIKVLFLNLFQIVKDGKIDN